MNNQQAGIIEFCVAKLTKYSSERPHWCSGIIHWGKTNTKNIPAWPVVILTAANSLWDRLKSETPFTASTSKV